ncbi:MAG: calcium/sodium antiporter [Alphaproteobacteria bacterium]|nr:calcium/sodium antiporter [Alphaproteobacteria bacterium]
MIYILILIGFAMLIYGGNILVDGAVSVARRMKVSPLLIGLTLVGFGTSTPELMTSLFAASIDAEGIAVGNVVGSNIANILLVLGVAAVIRAISVNKTSFKRDSLFLSIATGVLVLALFWGRIGFILGFIMCATLGYYVYYSYQTEKKEAKLDPTKTEVVRNKKSNHIELGLSIAKTILGIVLTVIGARVLVTNSVVLAERWGVSETIIGLTIVALGTSLPELATSIIASLKKHSDLAWGNVVGSNIYNALFILGVTALFVPVKVPKNVMIDTLIMVGVTALLLYFGRRGKLTKRGGWLFCALYVVYIAYLALKA